MGNFELETSQIGVYPISTQHNFKTKMIQGWILNISNVKRDNDKLEGVQKDGKDDGGGGTDMIEVEVRDV